MAENSGHLGVTEPLSQEMPNEQDLKLNEALMTELKSQNNFESTEDTLKRQQVLDKLKTLLHQLVQTVGKKIGHPPELLKEAGGQIFTYGSYRLGVYDPGSDIDTLMIAPKFVTRNDFFEYMPNLLKRSVPAEELPELVPVQGIKVPIIKLEMHGVKVDLIFASLQQQSIPKSLDLTDNTLLRGLSEVDLRCVNGTRVTDRILKLVPQTRTFRVALRAVKLWARKRAMYGNVVGFPGGVAYAMMVARVCQLYPKAAAPKIVNKFFYVMQHWDWPNPVLLQKRENVPFMQEREWDPNSSRFEKFHLMPIITPAYPCMNATGVIIKSTKAVLLQELGRGHEITNDIYSGKKQWKDLFVRHKFFSEAYRHYICVVSASTSREQQQAWSGLVQSRLIRLMTGIENSDADSVKLVHPFNKGIEGVHECKTEEEAQKTFDGSLDYLVAATKTADPSTDAKAEAAAQGDAEPADGKMEVNKEGAKKIWTTRFYLGIELEKGKNNLDISWPIQDFKRGCCDWDTYNTEVHSIRIKHIRNYDLHPDVFVDGETKPTKKKKKVAGKESTPAETQPVHKKRGVSSAGLDENQDPAKRRQSGLDPGTPLKVNGNATPNGSTG